MLVRLRLCCCCCCCSKTWASSIPVWPLAASHQPVLESGPYCGPVSTPSPTAVCAKNLHVVLDVPTAHCPVPVIILDLVDGRSHWWLNPTANQPSRGGWGSRWSHGSCCCSRSRSFFSLCCGCG
ncbi:hypothetical protein B0T19DRAFT_158265 [Cercophora scortea]|uniref:Secreted protein n=1 Tax=Cercophora scortea TaxID=314031 RepID=A0AAE0ILP5_9PEZI|nr:hypothetical protein B0T19DRAFT_158265 [Cercophora scortea]